ncbi:MAG: hypothetical protein LBH40_05415 [Alphaproteobacteria bacterium]|jgi:uncharacterized protein YukE|nr:hypothetical protein [Alphaproteobacteria bacterium]
MSLKVNFFPLHFILSTIGLVVFSIVFSDTIYSYMAENVTLNGAIIGLFIFAMIWIFGCLSYYARSVKLINNLFNSSLPTEGATEGEGDAQPGGQSMYIASAISGTLIDNPIASKVLSNFAKTGKLDISYSDAMIIVEAVDENGDRILGPAKFLAGVFILLGLFGTFIGLLHTIDGVGVALKSVSDADNVDVFGLVGLLVEPLQGMGMAFSASLFGLTAGLFANYGLFVCVHQLAVFVNKLKNFLTATTGMTAVDPAEIKAEDILLALEDSFNKLSVVFAEKLDMVTEGLLAMSKVIARGQDRQEKISKASLINLVKVVEFAEKLNILESLDDNVRQGLEENRIELFKFLDAKVVANLNQLLDSVELNNRISTDHVELAEKTSVVIEDLASMTENLVSLTETNNDLVSDKADTLNDSLKANGETLDSILESSDESLSVLEAIDGKTTGIDYRPNFDDVVSIIAETNELTTESNALSDEANNLADTLINKVATEDSLLSTIDSVKNVNAAVDDTIAELETQRGILNDTLDSLNDIGDAVDDNLAKIAESNDGILAEVVDANSLNKDILSEATRNNELNEDIIAIANDTLDTSRDSLDVLRDGLEVERDILDTSKDLLTSAIASEDFLSAMDKNLASSVDIMERWYDVSLNSLDELVALSHSINDFRNDLAVSNDYLNGILAASNDSANRLSTIDSSLAEQLSVIYNLERYSDSMLNNLEDLNSLAVSLNSRIDTITEGFSMYLPMMTEIMGIVRDEMNGLNSTVEILGENIYEMSQSLRFHGDAIGRFGEIVSVLDFRMENLDNATVALNSSLEQLLPTIHDAIDISSSNSQYLAQLIGTLDYIAHTADNIGRSMAEFANTVLQENAYIAEQVSNVSATVMDSTDRIGSVVMDSIDRVSNTVMDSTDRVTSSLGETSYALMDTSNTIVGAANTVMNAADLISRAVEQSTTISNDSSMAAQAMLSVVDDFSQLRDMYSAQMTEVSQLLSETISSVLATTDYVSNNLIDLNNLVTQVQSYSNDVMNTQEAIRSSAQGMFEVSQYIASSQDNFLNALNGSVNYAASLISDGVNYTTSLLTGAMDSLSNNINNTAAMLNNGMEIVVERLNNINMLTEVQTGKLDNLDYRLSELPETVTSMFMNLGDMFSNMTSYLGGTLENMQNLVYEIMSQNSQAQSAIMEAIVDNRSANSMVMDMVNQTTGLQSVIADLANQSNYANNMVGDLASQTAMLQSSMDMLSNTFLAQTDSLQSSMNMLADTFGNIYSGVMNTTETMMATSNSLFSISNELATQTDALERNSVIASNLSNDLQSLAFSNENLRDVGGMLSNVINSFDTLANVLSTVQMSADNMDRTFANYSDMLFGEISRLTETLNSHLNNFMSKDLSLGQDLYSLMNGISQATNDISRAINTFENLASDSIVANRDVRAQIENSMNYAISEIASIKENLGNNISERIIYEISQVSSNQYEMMNRLAGVMPQVDNLINILSSNSGGYGQNSYGGSSNNGDLLNALTMLREEHQNGNARLDIMANAVDTLITEILNSRDVAETILDVVTRMAGLTRN